MSGTDTMAKRSRAYIWQFVIGLGFISGVWTAIGIDPEAVILNVVGDIIGTVYSDPGSGPFLLSCPRSCLSSLSSGRTAVEECWGLSPLS